MQNFSTVEEKAVEWDITPRHIQYLCRKGKIKGAVKRAGSWFIPGDSQIPFKYTKSGVGDFRFEGTKNKIFNSAIELFESKGFNDVSLRDIAEKVGIRQSTIYNHFKTKQEILDTIYDFYCYHYLKDRPDPNDMEFVRQNTHPVDIIDGIRYDFKEHCPRKMPNITKIIFQRIAIDDRAREIGKSLLVDEAVKYAEDVFRTAIERGIFVPFDTHEMAVFLNSIRIFSLYNRIVAPAPDSPAKSARDEQMLYKLAAGLLTDLMCPDKPDKKN